MKITEKMQVAKRKTISLVMGLANKIINELGFVETINENVDWDKDHWGISPGQLAKAQILATFTDMRVPLTHLQERLSGYDLTHLIGPETEEHDINAFNVGRALDRIGEKDVNRPYEKMAMQALHKYDIPASRGHSDTTTVSFSGEYDIEKMNLTDEEKEEVLRIEKGYNKDGRRGDGQVVLGQIVNEHGIPLTCKVMNGSTSDIDWNKSALDYFDRLRESGLNGSVYVADCKVVTEELVRRMNSDERKVRFVSRCPANFDGTLASRVTQKAYLSGDWEDFGKTVDGKNACSYRGVPFVETVFGSPMRLLVIESSSLAAKAEASLEKARSNLKPLVAALEKKEFVCRADAEKELDRFKLMKELKLFNPKAEIQERTIEKWPRGRRSAQATPTILKSFSIRMGQLDFDEGRRKEFMQKESSFVLISNILPESLTNKELLKTYKGQHVVETSFRHLKNPSVASVIYLKNPKRIEALTMLLNFALLIRAIIQFRMRDGLKKHVEQNPNVPIFAGWKGRPLTSPTFKLLYEHSINCHYVRVSRDEFDFDWPNVETKDLVTPLLSLMGLDVVSVLQ